MAETSWPALLASLRERADRALAGLPVDDFVAPDGLGPVPAHLVDELRSALADATHVEMALVERRDAVLRELTAARESTSGFSAPSAVRGRLVDHSV
jgi:hypothetical protein